MLVAYGAMDYKMDVSDIYSFSTFHITMLYIQRGMLESNMSLCNRVTTVHASMVQHQGLWIPPNSA